VGALPLELVCHACDVVLLADTEDDLVDLAIKPANRSNAVASPQTVPIALPVANRNRAHPLTAVRSHG
jgi:hypothetical protein